MVSPLVSPPVNPQSNHAQNYSLNDFKSTNVTLVSPDTDKNKHTKLSW